MKTPAWLSGEAKSYFEEHYQRLVDNGVIQEEDAGTLALCADVWGQLRRINPDDDSKAAMRYNSLLKSWLALAKQLGLLPRDRKRSGLEKEQDIADVLKKKLEKRNDS